MIRSALIGTLALNVDALVSEKISEKSHETIIYLRCTQMIRLINSRRI